MARHAFGGALLLFLCVSVACALNVPASSTKPMAFDLDLVYNQLMYAYSAYCNSTKLQAWDCHYCNLNASTKDFKVADVWDDKLTSTFGYSGSQGSIVVIAFRGTTDLENWIADLDYSHTTPYKNVPGAYVHQGFYDTYEGIRLQVRLSVLNLVAKVKATAVYITGHSLGGALSTLCALDIVSEVKAPVTVVNFGSPRVGNQNFSDYYHTKVPNTFRVVYKDDIVPHLPRFEMSFWHVAEEVWWENDTKYKLCDMTGEDQTCSDKVLLYSVKDHTNYLGFNSDVPC